MSPRHKLVTVVWCAVTMLTTVVLSHGHLILREIMSRWPRETTWESRLESALYTQGGLAVVASLILSLGVVIRGYMVKKGDEKTARKEMALRERHERAAQQRHESMMQVLSAMSGKPEVKKEYSDSGVKPR